MAATLCCDCCAATYEIRNQKIYFIEPLRSIDTLDGFKEIIKRSTGNLLYRWIFPIVNPTFPFLYHRKVIEYIHDPDLFAVDLGSGNHRLDDRIIALDAVDYPAVDIVADLTALPFADNAIDVFASRSAIEHIHPIAVAVAEMDRATAPGGFGIHLIPLMYPYHSSIGDYQRLTHMGAARLFDGWQLVEQRHVTGPFTLLLVVLIEVLSIIFSFGAKKLKAILYLLFCLVLFPIKFLDFPFLWFRSFVTVAPTILTVLKKPEKS
ncbi:MAG TPA: methyltransferase domain-containing protein [Stellaceae bacterium]|nr:methyltransferase domain-containing protein [Stellaceae bacterium]